MKIRALSEVDIKELSNKVDFPQAAVNFATTMQLLPIDSALTSALRSAEPFMDGFWPSHMYEGKLSHAPIPEQIRKYYPKDQWEGYEEEVRFEVRGIEVDGISLLFFNRQATEEPAEPWKMWGVARDGAELVHERDLPIDAVLAAGSAHGLAEALAKLERSEISSQAQESREGAQKPSRL